TLQGAILHDIESSRRLGAALGRQVDEAGQLRQDVESVYLGAHSDLMTAATDGTMLRGEVLARWQDFVGSGEIFRKLERTVGSWRDRLFKRKPTSPEEVEEAALSGLHLMILDRAERAAEEVARAWD